MGEKMTAIENILGPLEVFRNLKRNFRNLFDPSEFFLNPYPSRYIVEQTNVRMIQQHVLQRFSCYEICFAKRFLFLKFFETNKGTCRINNQEM